MARIPLFILFAIIVMNTSCEKCKRCSYTHDVTTIIQTVNGEVEEVSQVSGTLTDTSGAIFSEECVKKDEPETIEQFYQNKKDTTVLDNFQFTCVDV
jgi:hypothetical protein